MSLQDYLMILIEKGKIIPEKLNEFFTSVFTAEETKAILTQECFIIIIIW